MANTTERLNDTGTSSGALNDHKDIWGRVIVKRRAQWNNLSPFVVDRLAEAFTKIEDDNGNDRTASAIPTNFKSPHEKLEFIIHRHFYRSIDDRIPPLRRRFSWQCVQSMLSSIDEAVDNQKGHSSSDASITNKKNASKNPISSNMETNINTSHTVNTSKSITPNSSTVVVATSASINKTSMERTSTLSQATALQQKASKDFSSKKVNEHRSNAPDDDDDDESLRTWAGQPKKKRRLSDKEKNASAPNKKGKHSNNHKGKTVPSTSSSDSQRNIPAGGNKKTSATNQSHIMNNNVNESHAGTKPIASVPKHVLMAERNPALRTLSSSSATGTTQHAAMSKKNATKTGVHSSTIVTSSRKNTSANTSQNVTRPNTISQESSASVSVSDSIASVRSSLDQTRPPSVRPISTEPVSNSIASAQSTLQQSVPPPSARIVSTDSISASAAQLGSNANLVERTEKTVTNGNSTVPPSKNSDRPSTNINNPAATEKNRLQKVKNQSNASMLDGVHQSKITSQPQRCQPTKPVVDTIPTKILFQADNFSPPLTGALSTRSVVRVTYQHHRLSRDEMGFIKARLCSWEPYWESIYEVMDRTSPVSSIELFQKGDRPHTALECDIAMPQDVANLVSGWNLPSTSLLQKYSNGQVRLILRMIPLSAEYSKKKKRADTHMWPKGTFLQVLGRARSIVQRKQQSHDHSLWKNMSYVCDLTGMIAKPCGVNRIQICCVDNEPYAFSVAVCRYRSPSNLYSVVCNKWLKKLSHQESIEKALQHISQSTVVLDDEDDTTEEVNDSMTFSLSCPISKTIIETPVRGTKCKHWQCFDLKNFLQTNEIVSGGRWRCGVCEQFLSCKDDLELCGFYTGLLEQYKGVARTNRDRVQLFSNKKWVLMEESKLRYAKKRTSNNDNGRIGSSSQIGSMANHNAQEEIIIL